VCGGAGCSKCQCKDEIWEVREKASCTLQAVEGIEDDTRHLGNAVCTIGQTVESNNDLLVEILKQVIENGAVADSNPIVVNCGCCGEECDSENPDLPPGDLTPPEEEDPCESATNVFVDGHTYNFSQFGVTKRGVRQVFLGTSAIN
jgi:hypothetical protein